MSSPDNESISPDAPPPPGTPEVDLDVPVPPHRRDAPDDEDVTSGTDQVEPPD